MASADVQAATYHGSCGLRTIATISAGEDGAARKLPRAVPRAKDRRVDERRDERRAQEAGCDDEPTPSCGAARATQAAQDDGQQPLRRPEESPNRRRPFTAESPRRVALERRRHDQPIDAHAARTADALAGPSTNAAVAERIGEHRASARRPSRSRRRPARRRSADRGCDGRAAVADRPFVVARRADRCVGHAHGVDQLPVERGDDGCRRTTARRRRCAAQDRDRRRRRSRKSRNGRSSRAASIDGESLRDRAEIEHQRAAQRDRPSIRIEMRRRDS